MNQNVKLLVYFLIAVNLITFAAVVARPFFTGVRTSPQLETERAAPVSGVKWTLFVGLNDKDAGIPLVAPEEAKRRLNAVAAKHVGGFTVDAAEGFWVNADGEEARENTLIYYFLDATEEQISAIVDEMKTAMNQGAILIEKTAVQRAFR